MESLLWLVPAFPFAGAIALSAWGGRMSRRAVSWIGAGSVGLSALVAIAIGISFASAPPPGGAFVQRLWTWLLVDGLGPGISFRLDALSLVMMLVVTFVGFLIHLYSTEYMADEPEGFGRFFAYMNLFVGSMLVLVLADNLLLLYLGWEGVGLCSYLLIGFWYRDPANGRAARKAFLVTRVGDTAMIIGLFLLFARLGTLDIQLLLERARSGWAIGSEPAIWAAALLLGGALGKSAQLPLQTWLPDAMAGPTPVSALIHAATMVTAGVYLIARMAPLFVLAPPVLAAVAVIGAVTLLFAGVSAIFQTDIKRVLAWSTISQIGYMFLALGVGAFSEAIFHFMTHAFFKALLFLAAGAVILSLHHEQDLRKMGGLRKEMPLTFWTFLIGGAALTGVPLVTAGFYSKDLILRMALTSERGSAWLFAAGLAGVFLTALYTFRLLFLAFWGPRRTEVHGLPRAPMALPLVVLAALSISAGWIEIPRALGGFPMFTRFLEPVLPRAAEVSGAESAELTYGLVSTVMVALGILAAWALFLRRPRPAEEATGALPGIPASLQRFWRDGWDFDRLYNGLFVRPFEIIAHVGRHDVFDRISASLAWLARAGYDTLRPTQTGQVRVYAAGIALGAIVLLALAALL